MATPPTFREALRFWFKLGFISFGGPAGQIAIMHTELVEKRKWIGEQRFLHALNFCMLLPGPEATQLATYCGWLLHRTWGGIVAGVLFILPSAILLWGLSWIYAVYGHVSGIAAVFHGLKPAVTAIVAAAVIQIGRRALHRLDHWATAAAAFAALYFFAAPFPLIVMGAALVGFFSNRSGVNQTGGAARGALTDDEIKQGDSVDLLRPAPPSLAGALRVLGVALLLWWTPVVGLGLWQGWDSALVQEGFFFSKAAMVTFGGAYAVLPYVGQQAVEHYGWLTAPQMLDGLGLAETTPGPLIMVVQFIGFQGGWNHPGNLAPLWAGTLGACITTWTTFVPCFLWIFLGAPYIEQLRSNRRLASILASVTAAVVGVVLNLTVWFGLHVFHPARGVIDWWAVAVAVVAFVALRRFKVGIIPVVIASGTLGLLWSLARDSVIGF